VIAAAGATLVAALLGAAAPATTAAALGAPPLAADAGAPASAPAAGVPASRAGAAGGAPAADAPASQPAPRSRWYVVPNFAFDTDDGVGFGVRGEVAFDAPGYAPYRMAYVAHAFFTLRGYHHHRLRFDRTGLGRERRLRLTLHLAWRQWLNDGYWGLGNRTLRERAYVDDFADDDPARKRYRYTLFQPFAHLTGRYRLSPGWLTFASLNAKWSAVRTYPGSLLEAERPYGMDGGLGLILATGILYDTRRPEVNPERGVFAEASGRYALPGTGQDGNFGGALASVRGYYTPVGRLTLAGRLMAEWLFGDVPFYELVHWGGAVPVAGFGGSETLRGVPFGRFRGPGKALVNTEARVRLGTHAIKGRPLVWQVALLGDAGVTWGGTASGPAGGPPVHPTGGVGLRAIFDETFVGRIDTGVGLDPIREPDGRVTNAPSYGLYVVFDHAF
jgi:hypothetical protein